MDELRYNALRTKQQLIKLAKTIERFNKIAKQFPAATDHTDRYRFIGFDALYYKN